MMHFFTRDKPLPPDLLELKDQINELEQLISHLRADFQNLHNDYTIHRERGDIHRHL